MPMLPTSANGQPAFGLYMALSRTAASSRSSCRCSSSTATGSDTRASSSRPACSRRSACRHHFRPATSRRMRSRAGHDGRARRVGPSRRAARTALAYTRVILASVPSDRSRWAMPTPCAHWDLAALLAHMDDALDAFNEAAFGAVAVVSLNRQIRRDSRRLATQSVRPARCVERRSGRGRAGRGCAHTQPRARRDRSAGDHSPRLGRRSGDRSSGRDPVGARGRPAAGRRIPHRTRGPRPSLRRAGPDPGRRFKRGPLARVHRARPSRRRGAEPAPLVLCPPAGVGSGEAQREQGTPLVSPISRHLLDKTKARDRHHGRPPETGMRAPWVSLVCPWRQAPTTSTSILAATSGCSLTLTWCAPTVLIGAVSSIVRLSRIGRRPPVQPGRRRPW